MKTRIIVLAATVALTGFAGSIHASPTHFGPNGYNFGVQNSEARTGLLDQSITKRSVKPVICHAEKAHASACQAEKCCAVVTDFTEPKSHSGQPSQAVVCKDKCPMTGNAVAKPKTSR